jgi:hypothetical protein
MTTSKREERSVSENVDPLEQMADAIRKAQVALVLARRYLPCDSEAEGASGRALRALLMASLNIRLLFPAPGESIVLADGGGIDVSEADEKVVIPVPPGTRVLVPKEE